MALCMTRPFIEFLECSQPSCVDVQPGGQLLDPRSAHRKRIWNIRIRVEMEANTAFTLLQSLALTLVMCFSVKCTPSGRTVLSDGSGAREESC